MKPPLPEPECQFVDANGIPYAGGTVETLIPGTDTHKDTWSDQAGTALNTNPIVLDAAGRALIHGSGEYRFILKDATGNLIYDQLTWAFDTSLLITMSDVHDAVQAETDRAEAAEAAEVLRATAAETTLQANIDAETARAEAAEAALGDRIGGVASSTGYSFEAGESVTDSGGHVHVTFGTPFTSGIVYVVATVQNTSTDIVICTTTSTLTGFDCYTAGTGSGGTAVAAVRAFSWIAMGLR